MAIEDFFTTAVTVLNPDTTTDRYGNRVAQWATAEEVDTNGWLHDTGGTETLGGRDTLVSTHTLRLPKDTPISGLSRVAIGGTTYEVTEPPRTARTPEGPHHLVVTLAAIDDMHGS